MNKSKFIKRLLITALVLFIIAAICLNVFKEEINLAKFNMNLEAEGIKLMQNAKRSIAVLKHEGSKSFNKQGYANLYNDSGLSIFYRIRNPYYNKITRIDITNPDYSVYGIKVGDSLKVSIAKLKEKGFINDENGGVPEMLDRGYIHITLFSKDSSEEFVDLILISYRTE